MLQAQHKSFLASSDGTSGNLITDFIIIDVNDEDLDIILQSLELEQLSIYVNGVRHRTVKFSFSDLQIPQ